MPSGGKNPRSSRGGGIFYCKLVKSSLFQPEKIPMRSKKNIWFIAILLFAHVLAACSSPITTRSQPWEYQHVRQVDGLDTNDAHVELVAAYTRQNGEELEWRFDLLELPEPSTYDLYLVIDSAPGGNDKLPSGTPTDISWEILLAISAHGEHYTSHADGTSLNEPGVRVVRDARQDTIVLSVRHSILGLSVSPEMMPHMLQSQVFFISPMHQTLLDKSAPFLFDAQPPSPAHVFFAFWDTYQAYTPLLALRRWDGAHTGPYGGRHGLYNLLRTASSQQVPITLLDIKSPLPIYALDFSGNLSYMMSLANRGQISLVDDYSIPAGLSLEASTWYASQIDKERQRLEQSYRLPSSLSAFVTDFSVSLPKKYPLLLVGEMPISYPFPDLPVASPVRYRSQTIFPLRMDLPFHRLPQATADGPSLELKQALLKAQSKHPAVLVLGGRLPESSWGDAHVARETFHYMQQHPWIKILTLEELRSLPATSPVGFGEEKPVPFPQEYENTIEALMALPDSWSRQAAWRTFYTLTYLGGAPQPQVETQSAKTLGPVWNFILASAWESTATHKLDCNLDFNQDGRKDCLVANERFFALLDVKTGGLTFLLYRSPTGEMHQITASSAPLISGMSQTNRGFLNAGSEPGRTPMPNSNNPGQGDLMAYVENEEIHFMDANGQEVLHYKFSSTKAAFWVSFAPQNPFLFYHLPLALDAWMCFHLGWWQEYYVKQLKASEWLVGRKDNMEVSIRASGESNIYSFLEGINYQSQTEDPNLDYLPGVWLPFPMMMIELQPVGELNVIIR